MALQKFHTPIGWKRIDDGDLTAARSVHANLQGPQMFGLTARSDEKQQPQQEQIPGMPPTPQMQEKGPPLSTLNSCRSPAAAPSFSIVDGVVVEGVTYTEKIERRMPDAVICVAITDDQFLFAAGSVAGIALVARTEDNAEMAAFKHNSGINATVFCGNDAETHLAVGTFNGRIYLHHVGTATAAPPGESAPLIAVDRSLSTQFGRVAIRSCAWRRDSMARASPPAARAPYA